MELLPSPGSRTALVQPVPNEKGKTVEMQELVQAVKDHARRNYNRGGWEAEFGQAGINEIYASAEKDNGPEWLRGKLVEDMGIDEPLADRIVADIQKGDEHRA